MTTKDKSPLTPAETALRIIAARAWRNGALFELADKALRGETITIDDTDLTEQDLKQKILEGRRSTPARRLPWRA